MRSSWLAVMLLFLTGCGTAPDNLGQFVEEAGAPLPTDTDSDGDGFSDDEEVNFIPGTDPFDPTDNPANVRGTDGDGCSDYDELTLDGFCDNDPNTPRSGTCDVAYYNSDFGYGFDLPLGADLERFDDEQGFLFNAKWIANDGGRGIVTFVTRIQDLTGFISSLESASDYIEMLIDLLKADGAVFLTEMPVTLSNGDAAHLGVYAYRTPGEIPIVTYRVLAIKHNQLYWVSALKSETALTESIDAWLTEVVLSLCVD